MLCLLKSSTTDDNQDRRMKRALLLDYTIEKHGRARAGKTIIKEYNGMTQWDPGEGDSRDRQ
jgi:hypothetical protein